MLYHHKLVLLKGFAILFQTISTHCEGLKHSPGMMDLSKFLQHSDEENEEKLYDTVENVHQEVAKLKKDPENLPTTIDSEPESWDDTPPLPDDDHLVQGRCNNIRYVI